MKLFDVNVLIYAHRADQKHHDYYRQLVEELVNGADSFGLSPLTAVGFLKIVTHPRFPNGPTPLPQAVSVIESLTTFNHCQWTLPGKRHWELTRDLCTKCACSGKNVADAQHAAIAIEHASELVTRDTDFHRFVPHGLKLLMAEP